MNAKILICLGIFFLATACKNDENDSVALPDGKLAIENYPSPPNADAQPSNIKEIPRDPNLLDGRVAVDISAPAGAPAQLWNQGSPSIRYSFSDPTHCPSTSACSQDLGWQIDRSSLHVVKTSCICGVSARSEKTLSAEGFAAIVNAIDDLKLSDTAQQCNAKAPSLALEVTDAQGRTTRFVGENGPCTFPNAPRLERESFEILTEALLHHGP